MTEEERLFKEIEKLEVEPGDVVLITAGSKDDDVISALTGLANAMSSMFRCMVVIIGPDDCIKKLDQDMMESYGWVRKVKL